MHLKKIKFDSLINGEKSTFYYIMSSPNTFLALLIHYRLNLHILTPEHKQPQYFIC